MKIDEQALVSILKPGDLLAYSPKGFFGWLIRVKTWHPVAHVEIYVGNGKSVASRDGIGVGMYPLRLDKIYKVMQPAKPINLEAALDWFSKRANGQKYDWLGILVFTTAVKQGAQDRMFCSEFCTRFYRMAGLEPFQPGEDADRIAPFQLTLSPAFIQIWSAVKKPD